MKEITKEDLAKYWADYDSFIVRWFCVSAFFVLSLLSIPGLLVLSQFFNIPLYIKVILILYGITIPINILLKYGLGVKGLWLFNDTKDGDLGDPDEIEKAGHTGKNKLFIIIWWWFRNHSWNFNRRYIPNWASGAASYFIVIYTTLTEEQVKNNRWQWCSKDGVHGKHYVAAIINGKLECRFSEAGPNYQRQMGSGGNEYRFRFKNLWVIAGIMVKRYLRQL